MARHLSIFGMYLALLAGTVFAHHSFSAEFDANKPVIIKGNVIKLDFTNPHIWITLEAKSETGAVTRWSCEGGAPNSLFRQGWSRDSFKTGDEITIEGFRAKDGANTCNAAYVTFPDGKRVRGGSPVLNPPNSEQKK